MAMPTLSFSALSQLSEWEEEIVRSFLDHHHRIRPFWQGRLSFPEKFVYGHLLNKLYQDPRFCVPVIPLSDPFIYPFRTYIDSGDWKGFKEQLIYDPVDLLILIQKLMKLVTLDQTTIALR